MFHPFIIPFVAGALIFFAIIIQKFFVWIKKLDKKQKFFMRKNILSVKTLSAIVEVFREALLHRKIYMRNPLLGYMHMSLAFGWFLLIVAGKIESSLYTGKFFDEPWLGIFFRYFVVQKTGFFLENEFSFIMDFLLTIILSGLTLAIIKRIRSKILGMKRTTQHILFDKIALTSLWLIFPFRLLAESTTSAIHQNGDFLTGSLGNLLSFLPVQYMELPLWWAYSLALFAFFVCLPFSRYMHIPDEVILIFFRKWGLQAGEQYSGYTDIQLNACSRCGICIDTCQLNFAADIHNIQSVYFIRDGRYGKLTDGVVNNCLMCGRCTESCPVGLELTVMRQQFRNKMEIPGKSYYDFTSYAENTSRADVIYFAGCMTHLTPNIIISMKKIFRNAGVKFWFMDEDKRVCCGRPLRQQGFVQQSKNLLSKNLRMISHSGARLLVTSCPICYKSFTEEYALDIPVMHHTEYIERLIADKKLKVRASGKKVVFHDPCELGRGAGIYEQPRNVLKSMTQLIKSDFEKENALCCGGSLSNAVLEMSQQIMIRDNTLNGLTKNKPDVLVTACPLCKKNFIHGNKAVVMDIAELVAENIDEPEIEKKEIKYKKSNELVIV